MPKLTLKLMQQAPKYIYARVISSSFFYLAKGTQ